MPPTSNNSVDGSAPAGALQRGLQVLRCFGVEKSALASTELARMTGLPQPTVWRICKTLEAEGFLVSDPDTRRYSPSISVLRLGYAALAGSDITALSKPYLEALAERVGGTATLAAPQQDQLLITQRCDAKNAVILLPLPIGEPLNFVNTASGWAYFCSLDQDQAAAQLMRLPADRQQEFANLRPQYEKACKAYRSTGYMLNVDVFLPGLTSLAVAFFETISKQWHVIGCSAISASLATSSRRAEIGRELIAISRMLSGRS